MLPAGRLDRAPADWPHRVERAGYHRDMMPSSLRTALFSVVMLLSGTAGPARAVERVVGPGEAYAIIQAALDAAVDGDVVTVRAGTYAESLATRAPGVTLRADPAGGEVVVTSDAGVLLVRHARVTVEGLVLDGNYGPDDAVVVDDAGTGFTLRRATVRRSGRDCIDLRNVSDVTIEQSLVHHCLWASAPACAAEACRSDAHGIVGGAVQNLVIRDTEIHTFSGDAFQVDPGRGTPSWTDVTIERCHIWLAPLAVAEGGYAAGVVPGENAVDTKTPPSVAEPARIVIRDSVMSGFGSGLIGNMAAFNLKENVAALVERVTVSGSEIAFRLRGATSSAPRGAQVTLRNVVVHDVAVAVRYENDIVPVRIENVTFGNGITTAFVRASAPAGSIDAHNLLVLGAALPADATGASNLAVGDVAFLSAAGDDYRLAGGSAAIDVGEMLAGVAVDRDGTARPQGAAWDVGAYEACSGAACAPGADAGGPLADAGSPPTGDGGVARVDAGGVGAGDAGPSSRDGGGAGAPEDAGCGCRVARGQGRLGGASTLAAVTLLGIAVVRVRARRRHRARSSARVR